MKEGAGELLLCPTPIGNLEDITLRVLRTLKEVDIIAAEDTRKTRILLNRYAIGTRLISYHKYNEIERSEKLLQLLFEGRRVAIVSDAGTPGISDPGARLVRKALEAGVKVTALPGPSAVLVALVSSGLPIDRFAFEGFLPSKKKARREHLLTLVSERRTMVFYEAPHRLADSLQDLLEILGDRPAVMARELTKIHEEVLRGCLSILLDRTIKQPPKGEICLIVGGQESCPDAAKSLSPEEAIDMVMDRVSTGESLAQATRTVSKMVGIKKSDLYRMAIDRKPG